MSGIGELLKEERIKRGWTIADVHEATKISMSNLMALEDENFDTFANKVYARAFLRDYANYLGLDSAQLLQTYEEMESAKVQPSLPQSNKSSFALAFIVFLIAVVAFSGIFYAVKGKGQLFKSSTKQSVVTQKSPSTPAPAEPKSAPETPVKPDSQKADVKSPSGSNQEDVATNAQASPIEKPASQAVATPADSAINDNQLRFTITVSEKSWVQIWIDGKSTYVGTILPDQTKDLTAKRTVKLLTGNAGGVKVKVDGVDQPSLGRSGEVVTRTWRK